MVSFKAEVSTPFPSLRLDCCMQEGFHWGRDVWLDASHSPFSIPPTPHWLPVFPTLPGLELEEREEIRGTEKFLLDWYFLDSVNVSSETSIVTKSLSVENNCVSILAGCLLLPPAQLFSSRVQGSLRILETLSGSPQGQNPFHNDTKVCFTFFTFFLSQVCSWVLKKLYDIFLVIWKGYSTTPPFSNYTSVWGWTFFLYFNQNHISQQNECRSRI